MTNAREAIAPIRAGLEAGTERLGDWMRAQLALELALPGQGGRAGSWLLCDRLQPGLFESDAGEALIARVPRRRLGTPEDRDGPFCFSQAQRPGSWRAASSQSTVGILSRPCDALSREEPKLSS